MRTILAILCTVALLALGVLAQQGSRGEYDDFLVSMDKEIKKTKSIARSSDELAFDVVFPGNENNKFVTGELAEVAVGVTNKGKHATAVFAVGGFFAHATNVSKPVHEIRSTRFNIRLEPKQEATLALRFTPEMEAQELVLVVNVDYYDLDESPRRLIVHEAPVTIAPADWLLDLPGISVLVTFGALFYFGGKYLIAQYFGGVAGSEGKKSAASTGAGAGSAKKAKKSAAEIRAEVEAKKETLDDEWIPEHLKKTEKKKTK